MRLQLHLFMVQPNKNPALRAAAGRSLLFGLAVLAVAAFVFPAAGYGLPGGLNGDPSAAKGLPYGAKGTLDYIQYWSAFHLAWEGANPYDGVLLHQYQLTVGQDSARTIFMWNPPWLLVLLGPVLALPFGLSALVWLVLTGVILFVIACMFTHSSSGFGSRRNGRPRLLEAVAAALFFYPVWENILWGQTGVYLALWIALFYWAAQLRRDLLAGLALVPLTIKPHLFYLLVPVFGVWLVRERRFKIAAAAAVGFGALFGATALLFPGAVADWFALWTRPPHGPGVVTSAEWTTCSIASWLRVLLSDGGTLPPTWPMSIVPLVTLVLTAGYLAARRITPSLERHFFPLLAISIVTGPYGWLYDQSVLLSGQVLLVLGSTKPDVAPATRRRALVLLTVLQLLLIATGFPEGTKQHHFAWFPLAFALLWALPGIPGLVTPYRAPRPTHPE